MNAQDEMYAKMAHLSSKKQEGLREKIDKAIGKSEGLYNEMIDSILQQVIEWANKCIEDTYEVGLTKKEGEVSGYGQAFIEGFREAKSQIKENISQLKEEK